MCDYIIGLDAHKRHRNSSLFGPWVCVHIVELLGCRYGNRITGHDGRGVNAECRTSAKRIHTLEYKKKSVPQVAPSGHRQLD